MSINDPVHNEGSDVCELFEVLESVNEFLGLLCPHHVIFSHTSHEFFLILIVFILVALDDHFYETLETYSADDWLIDKINFQNFIRRLLMLNWRSTTC